MSIQVRKMEVKNRNLCENCKHYRRLYIKKPSRLVYSGRGYCLERPHDARKPSGVPHIEQCDFYSYGEGRDIRREEDMKIVLRDMAKSLADIALMLGVDEAADDE